MLKNRYGFVPKGALEPNSYRLIFNGWCAIYRHPKTGQEYHVQLVADALNPQRAKEVQVLRKEATYRQEVTAPYRTIKGAVGAVERLLSA